MVTAVLGQSYGLPTWNACLSDVVVMLEGASMAVSGPRVLELATGEKISPEELGGIKVHAEETGLLMGADEQDMKMELSPTAVSQIPSQETVVTTSYTIEGSQGLYPPDIPIGTVSRVFAEPGGLATSVTVRPAVDFSTLKFVSVVRRDAGG